MAEFTPDQYAALLNEHQVLDRTRVAHVGALFDFLSQPVPDDGRMLIEAMQQDCPHLLACLQTALGRWVDQSNEISALATARLEAIRDGTLRPDGRVN